MALVVAVLAPVAVAVAAGGGAELATVAGAAAGLAPPHARRSTKMIPPKRGLSNSALRAHVVSLEGCWFIKLV